MQPVTNNETPESSETTAVAVNLIEELDITEYLVLKKPNEDGPDVKGGYLDALIVHASQAQKHTENSKCRRPLFLIDFISLMLVLIRFKHIYILFLH